MRAFGCGLCAVRPTLYPSEGPMPYTVRSDPAAAVACVTFAGVVGADALWDAYVEVAGQRLRPHDVVWDWRGIDELTLGKDELRALARQRGGEALAHGGREVIVADHVLRRATAEIYVVMLRLRGVTATVSESLEGAAGWLRLPQETVRFLLDA